MPHLTKFILSGAVACAAVLDLQAVDLIKADNSTGLKTAGSYTDGAATPTNADWLVFNNTLASTTTFSGGGAVARGLRVVDPANNLTLALGNQTFSLGVSGSTTNGGSIDMSSATKNLTITSSGSSGALRFYGSQAYINVATGRTLTVSAPVFVHHAGGGSLQIQGAGDVSLNGVVSNSTGSGTPSTRIVYAGTGTLTLGGANTYTGGTAAGSGIVAISRDFAMGAASVNAIGLNAGAGTHGKIAFGGSLLTFGGSLQLDLAGTFESGGTFDLIDLGTGASAGGFSSVSIAGSYVAALVNNGSGVWSGTTNGTTFIFDQASGDLTVSAIPEPSTFAFFTGVFGLGAATVLRKRRV